MTLSAIRYPLFVLRCLILATALVPVLAAQGRNDRDATYTIDNVGYDGRFSFVRLRFDPIGGDAGFGGRPDLKWDHDYPRGERNLMKIISELTTVRPHLVKSNVLRIDDPELMKHPVAYMAEPGFLQMSEKEVAALRAYLLKGGFLIFDDFAGAHWMNFASQMRRVLPDARPIEIDVSHPIFDAFYRIESLEFGAPYGMPPRYLGIFQDNDPTKRLMAIVNYNNDIGEYWEWSDTGLIPIDLSNEAYKLGVNYIVYGLTR